MLQRISTRARRYALLTLAAGVAMSGVACAGPSGEREARKLRYNLTPEMYTLDQRPADVRNTLAIVRNENTRMIRGDLSRTFYTDRQSRLTREPVPR